MRVRHNPHLSRASKLKSGGEMTTSLTQRREFLKQAGLVGSLGSAAMMAGLPESAMAFGGGSARIVEDAVAPVQTEEAPKYHIKFAVCGMSHDHIYGMIGAVQRGGGELVAAWGGEKDKLAKFRKRFPDVKIVATQDEILDDPSVQLVLTSQVASERAGIAVRAMKRGKDVLSDKPGLTTLEQLAEVRKTIAETKRIYAILYSELLEVKAAVYAGVLGRQGAIGKVIQTINIAPHQIVQGGNGDSGGANPRPDWFWNPISTAEFCATSARIRWINSCSTQGRQRRRLSNRKSRMCAIPSIRASRTLATWSFAAIAASVTCVSTGSRPMAWEPGATHACSFWAPTVTWKFANTPTLRSVIRETICL
jgi:hypothetical protein